MPRSSSMGSVATQTNQLILMTLHEERAFSKTGSTLACTIITVVVEGSSHFSHENNGRKTGGGLD